MWWAVRSCFGGMGPGPRATGESVNNPASTSSPAAPLLQRGKELVLQREDETPRGIRGQLTVGAFTCFTLERSLDDPVFPAIPPGRYPVRPYTSPHFRSQVLLLSGVPERNAIEVHAGNTIEDSHGCILVGNDRIGVTLIHSRAALSKVLDAVPQPTYITIKGEIP